MNVSEVESTVWLLAVITWIRTTFLQFVQGRKCLAKKSVCTILVSSQAILRLLHCLKINRKLWRVTIICTPIMWYTVYDIRLYILYIIYLKWLVNRNSRFIWINSDLIVADKMINTSLVQFFECISFKPFGFNWNKCFATIDTSVSVSFLKKRLKTWGFIDNKYFLLQILLYIEFYVD